MWIVTEHGFFSIVKKHGDEDLTVRARLRNDIEKFADEVEAATGSRPEVKETPENDYQYRVVVPAEVAAKIVGDWTEDINYHNFKSRVAEVQGNKRAYIYHKVWDALQQLVF